MKRCIRLCLLSLFFVLFAYMGIYAKKNPLSGTIGADSVRVILKSDTTFIDNPLIVKGTLIIEPGARIEFYDNSRIIVAAGGRVIADGFAKLAKKSRPTQIGTATQIINTFTEGYHDMKCFLYPIAGPGGGPTQMTAGLVGSSELGARERTIHPDKYNTIFNVAIDIANRRLVNIKDPNDGTWPKIDTAIKTTGEYLRQNVFRAKTDNTDIYVVPYETAIMFMAARMNEFPATNDPLTLNDWKRTDGSDVAIIPNTITFVGQPQTSFSREWGHIVVLPGARTAFFRNCLFQNIKKDITVDNIPFYESVADIAENLTDVELNELNKEMLNLTNGGGGAITTFSSRTWIVDCQFDKNFARLRGGALQILQAPTSFFYPNRAVIASDTAGCERFKFNDPDRVKNYRVSDEDKLTSTVMTRYEINYPRYPMIDKIDESGVEDIHFINDIDRQAWDDARLAGYLGRFRNLDFTYNMVRLANVDAIPDEQGHTVVRDDTNSVVLYPYNWGNGAKGGAIYIAGTEDEGRQIEFTLGMNDSIRLGDFPGSLYNPNNLLVNKSEIGYKDYLKFVGNTAQNYQDNKYSDGAKGGAIYVGKNTSLIVAGQFIDNYTDAKWLVDTTGTGKYTGGLPTPYVNGVLYSQGGAIYADPDAYGRLQIRGDREKDSIRKRTSTLGHTTTRMDNSTQFIHNRAGAGGAIFVEESPDVFMSPQIGGSDVTRNFNNYGWKIRFANNYAYSAGGAIYTKRNMDVNGAGGARENYVYSLAHLIRFDSNAAGFSGGAIHVEIPLSKDYEIISNTRIVNLRRSEFKDNNVNKLAFADAAHLNNGISNQVRGGGAVYTLWADLNVVRGVHFVGNTVYNGNGGAIEMVNPYTATERLFITDLDIVHYAPIPQKYAHLEGLPRVANDYTSVNNPFTFGANYNDNDARYVVQYPDEYDKQGNLILEAGLVPNPNAAMLTRFEENSAIVDEVKGKEQIDNYGNTQISKGYIMPNVANTAQFWTSEENGFVGGNVGHLVNIYYQNSNWNWSDAFNDSLFHNYRFNDIYFSNTQTGYFATNHGSILKTTDKGAHWSVIYQSTDLAESITDMSFIGGASDRAIAVTDEGRIITTENGNTWNLASWNYLNRKFYGIHLVNGTLAFAVGSAGTVIKMTKPGADWNFEPIYVPGLNKDLYKVFFVSATKGFAIGEEGTFIQTTDGGNSWDVMLNVFPRNDKLNDISFFGTQIGYLSAASGYVWKTTDGGATWTRLDQDFGRTLNSLFLLDYDKLFVVGEGDLVMRSIDGGATWTSLEPYNKSQNLGNPRTHADIPTLVENGIGLGGAIYILDNQNRDDRVALDSIQFNRTRIVDNFAFTGSALYSDNYNLKLFFNRSLIRGNKCDTNNTIGILQNHINGPLNRDPQFKERNYASSDLASATIYGEIQGPFPTSEFSTLSNSIFENEARFLIRLPDAPNTKGILAGQNSGIGKGGTDTLIGNYWGHTEANVGLKIMNYKGNHQGDTLEADRFMSFFVEKRVNGLPLKADKNYLPLYNKWNNINVYSTIDNRRQGPFEYNSSDFQFGDRGIVYQYIELKNADNTVPDFENIPGDITIPEKYLFSYDVYDLHDKGTDIKTADYSKRRMFPVEDFAVGNPVQVFVDHTEFVDTNDKRTDPEKREKYVKRWIRNPEFANAKLANGQPEYPIAAKLQRTWVPLLPNENATDNVPRYYHPLGMPIYLETKARTNIGDFMVTNRDFKHQGSTVFFVINETTQDFIRVDLKQIPRKYGTTDSLWADDIYRATVFLTPDSSDRGNTSSRRLAENLFNLGSNGTYPFGTDPDAGSGGSGSPELLKKLSPRALSSNEVNPGIGTAAMNEDYAALAGRKYSVISERYEFKPYQTWFKLGDDVTTSRIVGLFSNRPTMPEDNDVVVPPNRNETITTFYAGERYGTLPANVGDVIRVVSRNVLWRQGITKAYDGGLVFIVKEGPEAPVFTGDITTWGTPELNPYVTDTNGIYPVYANQRVDEDGSFTEDTVKNLGLLNKIFVRTNRDYPQPSGTYSDKSLPDNVRGTDFILRATAIDRNGLYDPRNEILVNEFTSLIWRWNFIDNGSALERWLMADTIKTPTTINNVVYNGLLEFKGTPINPYIVPGGERFQVSARNYAPGVDMLDSLKASNMESYIPWFYQIFPSYLNTPYYNQDVDGKEDIVARYLQQDTIGIHSNVAVSEELRIYVMDSLPRFIAYKEDNSTESPSSFRVKKSNYDVSAAHNEFATRPYNWTRFQAGTTLMGVAPKDNNPKFLVNLTDKLRFRMDLNTDDELEDLAAEEAINPWDFRYGRTAYSFANVAISGGDTLVMDTVTGNVDTLLNIDKVSQLKPNWMQWQYFMLYNDYQTTDASLIDFQRRGQINIRIDAIVADSLLLRRDVALSQQYNTDTVVAIVANDGHGGSSTKFVDLYINFQPRFITEELLPAIEGEEYNMKRDIVKSIRIFDANKDQRHRFELIYDTTNVSAYNAYDRSFVEETLINWTAIDPKTPYWLKINPESGVLYGVPALIKNMEDTNAKVTILVEDEDGLLNIHTYDLKVEIGNAPPKFLVAPIVDCLIEGQQIEEDIVAFDRDLLRDGVDKEQLVFSVINPPTLIVEPETIDGQLTNDTVTVKLKNIDPNGLVIDWNVVVDGRIEVCIVVKDKGGNTGFKSDTLCFDIRVSEEVTFLSQLSVTNSLGHSQLLDWGTATKATTGDGLDKKTLGQLDSNYCEIEIPPLTNTDVFDARWSIPTVNGTYRNLFPTATQSTETAIEYRYKGTFQSGGVNSSGSSTNYPVTLTWKPETVPAVDDVVKNPRGSKWVIIDGASAGSYFYVNMHDIASRKISSAVAFTEPDTDGNVTISILDNKLSNFHIIHDWYGNVSVPDGVDDNYNYPTTILGVTPNPIDAATDKAILDFSVAKSGNITIELFDVLGNKVASIENGFRVAGNHTLGFDLRDFTGSKLTSGAYNIRLTSGMEIKVFPFIIVQ
jgi:predicted outer membrane repeat protein